ncbi:HAD-IA family hydrolase [Temperatibacter marinus]|uniref:HAD-IA family hydrolase n=1 Tax=Temperatibacter marinus TaxID=1456591 RepID=A0AA52EB42_9PROT|nr:HAD-IA family hydrolase [Temperatibacter marinus]WND01576.1 HAD-IA family hydrolase [Temperatibacter marinus]
MKDDMNKLVIFDCDGTLVDSQHMIVSTMHDTFSELKVSRVSDLAVRRIIGLSLEEAISELQPSFSQQDVKDATALYKNRFYEKRQAEGFKPDPLFPGCREAMEELSNRGYLLAVATGNSHRGMQRVIEQHALNDFFVSVQTADFHPSKPHPSMINTALSDAGSHKDLAVMIGDTKFDTIMASNAGSQSIGVAWGYHGGQELLDTGAKHLIEEYHELPDLVDRML